MTLVIHAFGDTNKGLFREGNEDNLMVGQTVFAVADGMGGHAAGEVASEAALGPLRIIDGTSYDDPGEASEALAQAVREANEVVIDKATANPELRGMGTTLTTVMVRGQRLHIAHVGDSRAYLLRGGILELLTEDHTLVNQLVKEGRLTEEQAASHPQRSVITRAIGVEHGVEVDVLPPLDLMPDDQILLCSDGLTGPVSEALIAEILKTEADGTIACQRLIDAANAGGGPDNITTVLLRVEGDGSPATRPAPPPSQRTNDEDATAELADPAALDARRLVELSDGNRDIDDTPPQLRGRRGRRIGAIVLGVVLIAAVVIAGGLLLLNRQFYVGVDGQDAVGIYRGIQGEVLGISLATLVEEQSFGLEDLPERLHQGLEDGMIVFGTLAEAETHVRTVLLPATLEAQEDADREEPSPSPSPETTETKSEPAVLPQPSPTSSP
ncbi:MAG TPA: Stp1/IreP family PP2C-type Ser/Thr phosphatase [Euzebya sp.]|nr:Stp1/IreP family PP2C-type Ser/Thr phosphatase [Euzebya sp.]